MADLLFFTLEPTKNGFWWLWGTDVNFEERKLSEKFVLELENKPSSSAVVRIGAQFAGVVDRASRYYSNMTHMTWKLSDEPGPVLREYTLSISALYIYSAGAFEVVDTSVPKRRYGGIVPYIVNGRTHLAFPSPDMFRLWRERNDMTPVSPVVDEVACERIIDPIITFAEARPSAVTSNERWRLVSRSFVAAGNIALLTNLISDMPDDTYLEVGLSWFAISQKIPLLPPSVVAKFLLLGVVLMTGGAINHARVRFNNRAPFEENAFNINELYQDLITDPFDEIGIIAAFEHGVAVYNAKHLGLPVTISPKSLHTKPFLVVDIKAEKVAPGSIQGLDIKEIMEFARGTGDIETMKRVAHIIFMHFNNVAARRTITNYVQHHPGSLLWDAAILVFTHAMYQPTKTAYWSACAMWNIMKLSGKTEQLVKTFKKEDRPYKTEFNDQLVKIRNERWLELHRDQRLQLADLVMGPRVDIAAITDRLKRRNMTFDLVMDNAVGAGIATAEEMNLVLVWDQVRNLPVLVASPEAINWLRSTLEHIDFIRINVDRALANLLSAAFLTTLETHLGLLPSRRQSSQANSMFHPGMWPASPGQITQAGHRNILVYGNFPAHELDGPYHANINAGFADPQSRVFMDCVMTMVQSKNNATCVLHADVPDLGRMVRATVDDIFSHGASFADVQDFFENLFAATLQPFQAAASPWTLGVQLFTQAITVMWSATERMTLGPSSTQYGAMFLTGMVLIQGARIAHDAMQVYVGAKAFQMFGPRALKLAISILSSAMTFGAASAAHAYGFYTVSSPFGLAMALMSAVWFGVPVLQSVLGAPGAEDDELQVRACFVFPHGRYWEVRLAVRCSDAVRRRLEAALGQEAQAFGDVLGFAFVLKMKSTLVTDPIVMLTPYSHARNYMLEPMTRGQFMVDLGEAATQVVVDARSRPIGTEKLMILVRTSWNFRRMLQGLMCTTSAMEGVLERAGSGMTWADRDEWMEQTRLTYPCITI
jgi:hypothetical protein